MSALTAGFDSQSGSNVERAYQASEAQDPDQQKMQRTSGRGRISTKLSAARTRINRLYQEGAARIRLPDHPGRNGLEAVIINTAGGVTGGDDLRWDAQAGPGTHLTVTTQACEKVYKADQDLANVNVNMTLSEGGTLHWLPQETIFFDKARLARTICVNMAADSSLLLVEPVIFGRKAMDEAVQTGLWHDTWRIHHKSSLIHAENVRLTGDIAENLDTIAGLHGHTALATIALVGDHGEAKLEGARQIINSTRGCIGGASYWSVKEANKLIVRLAARDGYTLRQALMPLINHLAATPNQSTANVPKIWSL